MSDAGTQAFSSTLTPADGVDAGVMLFTPLHGMYDRFEAAFLPLADEVETLEDGRAMQKRTFEFHVFRLPGQRPTTKLLFWQAIRSSHSQQCKWYTSHPDPSLARAHYTRTLLQRFAVVARTMAPPLIPKKHSASAPGTPRQAKKQATSPQGTPRAAAAATPLAD